MNIREAWAYGVPCDDARQTEANRLADEVKQLNAECQRLQMRNAELEADREALVAEALAHDCRQSATPSEDQ